MTNVFFPDEQVSENDLYFVCYMIERVARQLKQPNRYVANTLGYNTLAEKLSLANVLHAQNPLDVCADWIDSYHLQPGDYDVTKVNPELCENIPSALQNGKSLYAINPCNAYGKRGLCRCDSTCLQFPNMRNT